MITKGTTTNQASLAGRPNKPLDIFGFAFRYGPIIIVVGFFLLVLFVPLALKISHPIYEAEAKLEIAPVLQSLITTSDNPEITGYYYEYVNTQAQRLSSYEILSKAFTRLSIDEQKALLPMELKHDEQIARLKNRLLAYPISRTHFVLLAISGPNKVGLAPFLNAIMDVYLEKMRNELKKKNKLRLQYLQDTKTDLSEKIKGQEQQLKNISRAAFSSSFAEEFNVWQKKLVQMLNASVKIYHDRIIAENEFKQHKKAAKELAAISLTPLIEESVLNDQAIGLTSSWTYQELQKMRRSIDGVTKDNKDRQRVEQRMKAMREYERRLRKETKDKLGSIHIGKRRLRLNQELIIKEYRFLEAKKNEQDLEAAIQQLLKKSGNNSAMLLEARALEAEIKNNRDMFFRLVNRIYELEAASKAPLRVSIEARARKPESPASSNIKKLLLVCVAISFGSIGAFFLVIEYFDNRIRSPKDVIHALGHPPSWPISRAPADVPFSCVLNRARTSPCAKALRSLANNLLREHESHQSQVFLFTSVDNKSGTTGILANTAKALVYYTPRILVMDGILPNFGPQELEPSTQEVEANNINSLDIEEFFKRWIKHDAKTGVDVMSSFFPKKPESYNSRLFREILKNARRDYDFICVDSAPVLKTDFTEHLVASSDVAVLIAQGDSTLYRDLRQTAEILIRMEIAAIAPVLNWGGVKNMPWFEKYLDLIPARLRLFGYRPPPPLKKKGNNSADKKGIEEQDD